ncbi:alpha/beta fold hydrolase [Psychrobacter okhotskensis]|uniref:alpha/beta fold hydrolase n=1 Tax=Psychrobacter okhotskensis TaxID=212403 RepID=UPI00191841AB|nr:alpha/beta fold hydrolase [Psychrobacter okhotskensis]
MMIQTRTLVTTKDGEKIAIWKIVDNAKDNTKDESKTDVLTTDAPRVKAQNILLTHGTFSDKQTCLRIAHYLAQLGHHCYIMEWRGHGASSIPTDKFNFETVATYDFEATFRYLFTELTVDNLHCVTHSGGGACLTMFLIQHPQYINHINSISMFACQVYGAIVSSKNHVKILAVKTLNRMLGYLPANRLKLGPINESYYTMNQWYEWNLNKDFKSSFIQQSEFDTTTIDQNTPSNIASENTPSHTVSHNRHFDYRQHMSMITTPIYAISAKGDHFISPTRGCQLFFDKFANPNNVFREYAISHGDLDDYTHSRIMISRNAATEIWPTVTAWIEKHAR